MKTRTDTVVTHEIEVPLSRFSDRETTVTVVVENGRLSSINVLDDRANRVALYSIDRVKKLIAALEKALQIAPR